MASGRIGIAAASGDGAVFQSLVVDGGGRKRTGQWMGRDRRGGAGVSFGGMASGRIRIAAASGDVAVFQSMVVDRVVRKMTAQVMARDRRAPAAIGLVAAMLALAGCSGTAPANAAAPETHTMA